MYAKDASVKKLYTAVRDVYKVSIFAISIAILGIFAIDANITVLTIGMMGFAATVSGFVVKNLWMTAGGIISGIGLSIAVNFISGHETLLIMISAALLTLLLPGLYLKFKNR